MTYSFKVSGDRLTLDGIAAAVSGSINYYKCSFSFSDEWKDLNKFAVFVCDENTVTADINNGECFIPQEVLSEESCVAVGVYGSSFSEDNPLRISTDFSHIVIKAGAYREGTAPAIPNPDLWEIYFERVCQTAREDTVDFIKSQIAGIEEALDEIIVIQKSLIGGDNV